MSRRASTVAFGAAVAAGAAALLATAHGSAARPSAIGPVPDRPSPAAEHPVTPLPPCVLPGDGATAGRMQASAPASLRPRSVALARKAGWARSALTRAAVRDAQAAGAAGGARALADRLSRPEGPATAAECLALWQRLKDHPDVPAGCTARLSALVRGGVGLEVRRTAALALTRADPAALLDIPAGEPLTDEAIANALPVLCKSGNHRAITRARETARYATNPRVRSVSLQSLAVAPRRLAEPALRDLAGAGSPLGAAAAVTLAAVRGDETR